MKTIKNFFRSTWSKFIVNQFNKVDLEFKEKTIIESFRSLQIDSLMLKTTLHKVDKRSSNRTGSFYRVLTYFRSKGGSFVSSKLVNRKNSKTINQTFTPSIIN